MNTQVHLIMMWGFDKDMFLYFLRLNLLHLKVRRLLSYLLCEIELLQLLPHRQFFITFFFSVKAAGNYGTPHHMSLFIHV